MKNGKFIPIYSELWLEILYWQPLDLCEQTEFRKQNKNLTERSTVEAQYLNEFVFWKLGTFCWDIVWVIYRNKRKQ